jgi:O-succinylbenzoic acid--CoA ligase
MPNASSPSLTLPRKGGGDVALIDRGLRLSWSDLDDLANAWALRLESEGIRPRERVAVIEPAGAQLFALLLACLRTDVALVPLSPWAPPAEVERVLSDCRPHLLVREGQVKQLPNPALGAEGDVSILYTSGTTGEPKGVRHTLANHLASARGCQEALSSTEHDRWLAILSPHHIGGLALFLRSVICGQSLVTLPRFEERVVLETLEQERPTLVSLVPVMLARLLEAGGLEQLKKVRAFLVGGASAPAAQVRIWAELGLTVCPSYGLTETCSQVAIIPPGRAFDLAGSAGRPCSQAQITLDPIAGFGAQMGEIVVEGASVSPGYVNPGLRPAPADGAFRTGDLGRFEDGVLTVLGRKDDAIITGGENVQPGEVEAVLRCHSEVKDAAVAGLPDPRWGQVVAAWVVAPAGSEAELEQWCRERLSAFKVPRRWTLVPTLPRNRGGKLLRRALIDDPFSDKGLVNSSVR